MKNSMRHLNKKVLSEIDIEIPNALCLAQSPFYRSKCSSFNSQTAFEVKRENVQPS